MEKKLYCISAKPQRVFLCLFRFAGFSFCSSQFPAAEHSIGKDAEGKSGGRGRKKVMCLLQCNLLNGMKTGSGNIIRVTMSKNGI